MGADNALFSKPGNARWTLVSRGADRHEVYRPDGSREGVYKLLSQAAAIVGTRNKQADAARGRTTRACLCCSKPFQSEGIHNRMCTSCRGLNADGHNPYSIAPRNGRAR